MNDINVVFWGDSFVNRTGVKNSSCPEKRFSTNYIGNFPDMVCKKLFVHYPTIRFGFFNEGQSGDTSIDLIQRFYHIPKSKINILVLLVGYNDAKKISVDKFKESYEQLIDKIAEREYQIIAVSVIPSIDNKALNEKIKVVNSEIINVNKKAGNRYINVYDHFDRVIKYKIKIHLYEETKHLSELGNIYIADQVFKEIENILSEMYL